MIHGIHLAFICMGALTIFSTVVFSELRKGDGGTVSNANAKVLH